MDTFFDNLFDELGEDVKKERERVYTVSELTRKIRLILEDEVGLVRVKGELSNFTVSSAGHSYFVLKDAQAMIQCVMFKRSVSLLSFKPKDGIMVEITGNISVYESRGQYQIIVELMREAGIGELAIAFNELKNRLEKEGLFAPEHKKSIPFLPQRIGVVTSPTGAAIRDILNVIGRRFANVEVIIYPVPVQGKEAAKQIAKAIERLNKLNLVDVMIVGRGGGAIEDLWAFNEEIVARAIYKSKIPIISAVGHEIDFTISDFVADLRAPTPSAAAELVTQNQEDIHNRIVALHNSLILAMKSKISHLRLRLEKSAASYALRSPVEKFHRYQQRLDETSERLHLRIHRIISDNKNRYYIVNGRLIALSPLAILQRGYSIVYKEGKVEIIKSARQVEKGMRIVVVTGEGEYTAEVRE